MSSVAIKKKETVKVEISGSDVPHYITRIAETLSEIAVAGSYRQKGKSSSIKRNK